MIIELERFYSSIYDILLELDCGVISSYFFMAREKTNRNKITQIEFSSCSGDPT